MILLPLLFAVLPVQEPQDGAARTYPMSLEDVVRLVQENAPGLQQARLAALSAEGSALEAGGLFDTVLFADVTYRYAEQPASGFFTSFGDTKSRDLTFNEGIRKTLMTGGTLTLSANQSRRDTNYLSDPQSDVNLRLRYEQPLLRGGWEMSVTRDLRRSEFALDRSRASIRRANVDAVMDAVAAYWDLAFALEDLEVKRASLRLAEELRDMTQARFDVGAVAEIEVVQTEADIATRSDALLTAAENVRVVQDRLRALVFGLEVSEQWDWDLRPSSDPTAVATEAVDWQAALETARRYRADLREFRVDVQRTRLEWRAARHDLMPKLDLIAEGGLYDQDSQVFDAVSDLYDRDFPGYIIGLVFEMPLGDTRYEGAERRTRFAYQLAMRVLRDGESAAAVEVRAAVRDLSFQAERIAVTRRAREVAERQLEAEQRRLVEGASTNFQVLQFQTDLALAASQEAAARVGYAKAVVRLNTVRGLNWDGSRPDLAGLEDYTPGSELASD